MHVRSLLRYCSSAVAIGVAVMGPAMVIASGSCKTLSDKDSKFVEALVSMYEIPNEIWKDFPLENAIGPFEQDFPWISSCLANIDIPTLYFNVSSNKAIERCEQEMSSEEYICPLYRNKLVPCVNDIVLRTITDALDSTNGCCDALKTKVVESFGRDITPMANALMDLAGDIVCSNKTYATENGNEVTEACVDSIYRVINNERMDEFVVNMLQTPENQVCAAVTGAPYKTTTGKSAQLFTSFDACYTPIASLIQHIASRHFLTF
jgi:hypothetical protein